jgi:probable rRNA maturation factor
VPLALARIVQLASFVLESEKVPAAVLSIAFVTARRIAQLHSRYQHDATPTDIVTLQHQPFPRRGSLVVADIFIAPQIARENVATFGGTLREEIARLVIHGVLHAVGRTHPNDNGRHTSPMWKRQEALLRQARGEGIW